MAKRVDRNNHVELIGCSVTDAEGHKEIVVLFDTTKGDVALIFQAPLSFTLRAITRLSVFDDAEAMIVSRSKLRPSPRPQCTSCGGEVRSVRADAKHCSGACRSREYRKRKKSKGEAKQKN